MFSYLQYSTTYSTEGISKCLVIFNTVPRTALKEYPNVQLSSIQYHVHHWRNIQMFNYLQYSTTYSTEGISKCSVIFNTVPCTALKKYPNVQLSSIQYHVQHWRNIQMFSYLQYSTTYSIQMFSYLQYSTTYNTEGISKCSVIFNTVPRTALKKYPKCSIIFNTVPHTALKEYRNVQLSSIQYHVQHWRNIQMFNYLQYSTTYTALKEYPNVQLSSIQYHVQHWTNIQMFSYLQYSTTDSTEGISKCLVIFNTVPRTALKEYPNVQLSSIQCHVQHWRNIQMFSYLQYSTTYSTEGISKFLVIFNTVPRTAMKEYPNV